MSQLSQYSKARIAITTAFIINGSIAGTFYSRIADIKEELDLSNSALGFALLVVSIGVLVGLGFSGKQSAKRGSAPVTFYATYALGAALLIVGTANNYITLCLTFLVLGACLAIQDVAMNSHAIVLEHEADKRYMSTFHAMFSLGALGGGVVGAWFSQQNIDLMRHVAFIAMLVFLANFCVRNWFLPASLDQHPIEGKKKIKKPKLFLIVGLLGLCAAIGEGSAGDWGAILARDTFDATPFISTLPALFITLLISGLAISPVLISGYTLIGQLVPQNRLTEGFAWANTGAGLGIALASAISGWVIDNSGAQVAFWVVSVAGLLTFAITLITYRDLKRADSRSAKSA